MNADEIIQDFKDNMDKYSGDITYAAGMQGAITGILEKACGGKDNRKLVLKLLTGHTSSKDLHLSHWHGLYLLVLPFKPEGGKWGSANTELDRICNCLLNKSYDQPGQTKMEFPEFAQLDDNKLWIEQGNAVDDAEDKDAIPF